MECTKNSPIRINIVPISGSVMVVRFLVKGSKRTIKINISTIIYYKHPVRHNVTNCIGSDILSAYTSAVDRAYEAKIKILEFTNRTESFILFRSETFYEKVYIEDIQIVEFSSKKIDRSKIEEIPILKNLPPNDIIDFMVSQYDQELGISKDLKSRIVYIYPVHNRDSFHIVASNHIKYLKRICKYIEIEEIDWSRLENINWTEKRNVLLHPFLYPFASPQNFAQSSRDFAKLLSKKNKIGGFDVADSDRISKMAVELVNKIDLMIVPSNFAKDAYINSGVEIPVEVLPHGIPDEFLNDNHIKTANNDIKKLRKMKKDGDIFILYFLIHSDHRKGADLVKNVIKNVQKKLNNIYLIVKSRNSPSLYFSGGIRTINVYSWMNNNDLRLLYDTCDICISPSRGGGFELNALEAASRGVPTLVTNGGCFTDLIDYFIPIDKNDNMTQPLPGNPIHIGYGCEADIVDFEAKLIDVIDRLEYWKNLFMDNSNDIRKKYSWKNTSEMLNRYLKDYEFIG